MPNNEWRQVSKWERELVSEWVNEPKDDDAGLLTPVISANRPPPHAASVPHATTVKKELEYLSGELWNKFSNALSAPQEVTAWPALIAPPNEYVNK